MLNRQKEKRFQHKQWRKDKFGKKKKEKKTGRKKIRVNYFPTSIYPVASMSSSISSTSANASEHPGHFVRPSSAVKLDDDNFHYRFNVLKLQSVIHLWFLVKKEKVSANLLKSNAFKNLINLAWADTLMFFLH